MAGGEQAIRELFRATKLKDVMATKVKTLYEDDELSLAQEIFVNNRVFYIPVTNHNEVLVGLMSQKYLYRTQSPRKFIEGNAFYEKGMLVEGDSYYDKDTLNSYILHRLMQRNPTTMTANDTLSDALVLMVRNNLGCIVVIDADKHVTGMVTDREILAHTARILQGK